MNPIDYLKSAIQEKAEKDCDMLVVNDPQELAHCEMRATNFQKTDEESTTRPPIVDNTIPISVLFVGPYAIIIGSFTLNTKQSPANETARQFIHDQWKRYQSRSAIARSWLSPERSDELILLLTGPPGSESDLEWKAIAAQIERNDLVCRKLVWLPPADSEDWNDSVKSFLSRTFLARPWAGATAIVQRPLDALADVSQTLMDWQTTLDAQPSQRADVDYDALIAILIQEYKP